MAVRRYRALAELVNVMPAFPVAEVPRCDSPQCVTAFDRDRSNTVRFVGRAQRRRYPNRLAFMEQPVSSDAQPTSLRPPNVRVQQLVSQFLTPKVHLRDGRPRVACTNRVDDIVRL